jgi:O-methyltransferase involved in polyketide biosynthesis
VSAGSIVELGAGLSFRGLAVVESAPVAYVDTDLPDMVAIKRSLLPSLSTKPRQGSLRLEALDALDRDALLKVIDALPEGPVTIVNEGLLMYLDDEEKRRLAANLRDVLRARGGAWITADVYVRTTETIFRDERTKAFVAAHGIDEKKFASFEQAERFFTESGFSIAARARATGLRPSSRETWTLRV